MILTADCTFLSCSLNLVLHLNFWFLQWVVWAEEFRTQSLNVCPSLSKNSGETELFTGILWSESPNSIMQDHSWQITDMEYWSAKSFPKINGVLMPLTTYASTLILTGPSGVWKYRSISTYPEMEAFPVTWTWINSLPLWKFNRGLHFREWFLQNEGDVGSRINYNLGKIFIKESGWNLSGLRTKEGASWRLCLVLL